mgnify:CR=1 FL=1
MSVVNLSLQVLRIGTGLTLTGDTLSATAATTVANTVIAAAGSSLTLAGNDSAGATLVLGSGATITLSLAAWQGTTVRVNNQSGNYTVTATDYYVGYTGAGGHTITLPAASTNTGRLYLVKSRGGTFTLDVTGGGQLWTNAIVSSMSLIAGECATVVSDGTYWVVIAMAGGIITV